MPSPIPRGRAALLALLLALSPQAPQAQEHAIDSSAEAEAAAVPAERLPPARTTRHELDLGTRSLRFAATAGSITLTNPQNEPEADIAFTAYVLENPAPGPRPVTFVLNGGPGAASAFLHFGGLGPWRLPLEGEISPSQPADLVPNAETWLDFTDLVFVDPVGTGFSRLVEPNDELRSRYLSVEGDAEALADFISRWLKADGRPGSPAYFAGESYGGFRGPLIAERLQTEHGVGLRGMTLVSPVLDFGWWLQPDHAPLPRVALLPSLAAAAMEREGAFTPERLEGVETYATGEYVSDLLRGLQDPAAVARLVERVSELTDLDPQVVEEQAGRIDARVFAQELLRDEGRILSPYDAGVSSLDPAPERRDARAPDPILDAMTAPLTSAAIAHYRDTLGWLPERRYMLLNGGVNGAWDWDADLDQPEAVGALRRVLALDPTLRVLVAHGYGDLVTPYFASELILRQIRDFGPDARLRQENYRGGHMFYVRADSRRAFREDAQALYESAS